ncbi:MAG: hypothetical protein N2254_02000 [bacterium]|nr:hypothetical protein [bacterium]
MSGKKGRGLINHKAVSFFSVFSLAVLFLSIQSCSKKDTEGNIKEKTSVDVSVSSLKSVLKISQAVRSSVSARKAAQEARNITRDSSAVEGRMVTGRLITGRMVTARAPSVRKLGGPMCPVPSAPRLAKKENVCEEFPFFGSSILTLNLQSCSFIGIVSSCTVSLSGYNVDSSTEDLPDIYMSISFDGSSLDSFSLNCDRAPQLSCDGISNEQSAINFVRNLTTSCDIVQSYVLRGQASCFYGDNLYVYSFESEGTYNNVVIYPQGSTVKVLTCGAEDFLCSFDEYSCQSISYDSNRCLNFSPQDYILGVTSGCQFVSSGMEPYFSYDTGQDSLGCLVENFDSDNIPEYVYVEDTYREIYINIWLINEKGEQGLYLGYSYCTPDGCDQYISSKQVGQGGCNFNFSCPNDPTVSFPNDPTVSLVESVISYVNSISSACGLERIGYTRFGDFVNSCMVYDFTGDGLDDTAVDNWYYQGSGTSIIVESDGRATKYECVDYSCSFYVSENCSVNDQCEVSCTSQWVQVGSSYFSENEEFSCFSGDFNEDGSREVFSSLYDYSSEKYLALLVENDISTVMVCQQLDEEGIPTQCRIKIGSCNISSCENMQVSTIESNINSKCELSDYATCRDLWECDSMFYAFLSYESDPEAGFCSRVLDIETGDYVEIRRVSDGYEYVRATTDDFSSTFCPSNSNVDFNTCSISGCNQEADVLAELTNFVDEGTRQIFTFEVTDSETGAKGKITIQYYLETGQFFISAVLETEEGTLYIDGQLNEDGSGILNIRLVRDDGREIRSRFTIRPDGSVEEITDVSSERYTIELGADGSGRICDLSRSCENIS